MTNEAISVILEHFYNEARDSAQVAFEALELLRELAPDSAKQTFMATGGACADQLLRSVDDVRELLIAAPPVPTTVEEFDLVSSVGEIAEGLNLMSGKRAIQVILEQPNPPMPITQDRKAVEQVITRVLNTASKLAQNSEIRVRLSSVRDGTGISLAVSPRDAGLAIRLNTWLNMDLDKAALQDSGDVPLGIAVMVAGKHLRALGGAAELACDTAGYASAILDLPSQAIAGEAHKGVRPGALSVLVAEDCDESFVLTELVLRSEHVRRARDGAEALRMIQTQRFDVVLMDVHMPGMDGYAAIRSMRDWETQIGDARMPIMVLSSDDLATQRHGAAQCGCSGFLQKPLRKSDFTDLLDRLKQARTPASIEPRLT